MSLGLSSRLLSILQLTRLALAFTAVADSFTALLLASRAHAGASYLHDLAPRRLVALAIVSIGLYGFGMSLNDIIDRRRDRQLAAHRPLPSGRIGIVAAHFICFALALAALIAGIVFAADLRGGALSLLLMMITAGLITFYDFAGKYLVAPGLITLGLIRFFHASIAAPQLPLLWHPLLLLNHIVLLSTLSYAWEQKRPTLNRAHKAAVLGGLALLDAVCIGLLGWRRSRTLDFQTALWITPGLWWPIAAIGGFVILALLIRARSRDLRIAGQRLMLAGLLWLIVYDASFAAGYVSMKAAGVVLLLLPVSYLSVVVMRSWSKLVMISQAPQFERAR